MRTSFHHQPEAQHPNFQLSTSWQADYPIFWANPDIRRRLNPTVSDADDPNADGDTAFRAKLLTTQAG